MAFETRTGPVQPSQAVVGTIGTLEALSNVVVASLVGSIGSPIAVAGGTVGSIVSGGVQASILGTIDLANSSTTPLGANATFTGTLVDVLPYAQISVLVNSDQVGTVIAQFSADGTNFADNEGQTFSATNAGDVLTFLAKTKYYRIQYVNGPTAQTSFAIYPLLRPVPGAGNLIDIADVPYVDSVAQLVKAVIAGHTTAAGGAYVDVKVNPSGALTVDATNSSVIVGTVLSQANLAVASLVGSIGSPVSLAADGVPFFGTADAILSTASGTLHGLHAQAYGAPGTLLLITAGGSVLMEWVIGTVDPRGFMSNGLPYVGSLGASVIGTLSYTVW